MWTSVPQIEVFLILISTSIGPTSGSGTFWSHKPGGTAARNTDNSGRVITNPETCNRGPYTQFCGYFYTCRSQLIR
jgi:hypothetical protein